MTEEQKAKAKHTRAIKALEAQARAKRKEIIQAALEKIATSEDSTVEQKLEAARLIAALDGIRH